MTPRLLANENFPMPAVHLIFRKGLPPPPAIIYLRQETYSPETPAELVLAVIKMPARVSGCFVVVSSKNVRYRRFQNS